MGNMLINVLAFATINGLNGALESLISQSFGASTKDGVKDKDRVHFRHKCGIFYNRGRFVSTMIMIPIIMLFALSDKILVALH